MNIVLVPKGMYCLPERNQWLTEPESLLGTTKKLILVKEVVEREIVKPNGSVRAFFYTIAFGMGVNVQGASFVIHMGPSSDLDDYVQECGRVGRDEAL